MSKLAFERDKTAALVPPTHARFTRSGRTQDTYALFASRRAGVLTVGITP
jgi:hypothetical protein